MKVYHTIFNYQLSPNSMKVYLYLSSCKNQFNTSIVKISTISNSCRIASPSTVYAALRELEHKGLVTKHNRYNQEGNKISNGYRITPLQGKYFVLDTRKKPFTLSKRTFAIYMYLLKCADFRSKKAYPSINGIAGVLHICKNTVIAALKELITLGLVFKAPVWKGKHNLYHVYTLMEEKKAQKNSTASNRPCYQGCSHCKEKNNNTNIVSLYNMKQFVKTGFLRLGKQLRRVKDFILKRVVQKL